MDQLFSNRKKSLASNARRAWTYMLTQSSFAVLSSSRFHLALMNWSPHPWIWQPIPPSPIPCLHCERNLFDKLASSRSNIRGIDNLIRSLFAKDLVHTTCITFSNGTIIVLETGAVHINVHYGSLGGSIFRKEADSRMPLVVQQGCLISNHRQTESYVPQPWPFRHSCPHRKCPYY